MSYDLIIKNGTVIDGSGMPRFQADIGIQQGKIATVGRLRGVMSRETLDADGHIVSPGFIDAHTHMDAQVAWDPLGTCSCWHGVTSVVMGNCGFTLAPCKEHEKHLVMRNLERAEDISREAMQAGIDWTWETFSEYLDAVERFPKGINYASYIGHSALRTYVMGERAFEQTATPNDLEAMKNELRAALRAGAYGFTTSRTRNHQTADDRPVASRLADWEEVRQLVCTMGEMGTGIFEIAGEDTGRDPEKISNYLTRLRDLTLESGRPTTFGVFSAQRAPEIWPQYFELLDETATLGGRMFAQVHSRALNLVLSFETATPFDRLPQWREFRQLDLATQRLKLRDPALRAQLVAAANSPDPSGAHRVGAEARKADFTRIFFMDNPNPTTLRSVADIANQRRTDPIETFIDLALENDLRAFFVQPLFNEDQNHVLEMMRHPRSAVTFSDSGAHVSQIMDSSLQTHVLSHWVRDQQALSLEQAVRLLTFDIASNWEFHNRGLIRPGYAADIVVFDPEHVAPLMPEVAHDLPAGEKRLRQKSTGFLATVVNGEMVLRNGEHTGALSGRLLRGALSAQPG